MSKVLGLRGFCTMKSPESNRSVWKVTWVRLCPPPAPHAASLHPPTAAVKPPVLRSILRLPLQQHHHGPHKQERRTEQARSKLHRLTPSTKRKGCQNGQRRAER